MANEMAAEYLRNKYSSNASAIPKAASAAWPDNAYPDISRQNFLRNQVDYDSAKQAVYKEVIIDMLLAKERSVIAKKNAADEPEEKEAPKKIAADKNAFVISPREDKSSLLGLLEYQDRLPKDTVLERIKERYCGDIPDIIEDFIYYFSNHEQCVKDKVGIWNRVLLYGEPGVGKSYFVEILANELEVPLFSFNASIFKSEYMSIASQRIRKVFDFVKELNRPTILFIDEIDCLATQRTGSTHDEQRNTLIALLDKMQELQGNPNVFVITVTNVNPNSEILDNAIRNRFSGAIRKIEPLTREQRTRTLVKLFKIHELNPVLANEALADSLAYQIPTSATVRSLVSLVYTAKLKQHKNKGIKCICDYFNEALKYAVDTYDGKDPIIISCVHMEKLPGKEQKVQALMQIFKDKSLDVRLANEALASSLAYQVPNNISIQSIEALVFKARQKSKQFQYPYCQTCDSFNIALREFPEMNYNGAPVSIACVHRWF